MEVAHYQKTHRWEGVEGERQEPTSGQVMALEGDHRGLRRRGRRRGRRGREGWREGGKGEGEEGEEEGAEEKVV